MQGMSLQRYRALDLTDEKGYLCGKMLGDLGMDVIKVERPGGDPSRWLGPFYRNQVDPQKSLLWFAYNTSKRGITLNLASEEGRSIFLTLVEKADVIIESFQPRTMTDLGLSYEALAKVNSRLIFVSISGFGQSGPFSGWKAPDLVCMAMSGYMNLVGNPSRPPVRLTVPQAYLHASGEAATGCLIALWNREMSGVGQHVDASAQQAVAWDEFHNQNFWDMKKINLKRMGGERMYGKVIYRLIFECKDGHVIFAFFGGPIAAKRMRSLVKWMKKEGMADPFLCEFDWGKWSPLTFTSEAAAKLEKRFADFFMTKTKKELFAAALKEGYLIGPIKSIRDVVADPHLEARGFWQEVEHPELGAALRYPGAPYKSAQSPCRIRRRAPLIGEHNDEIYGRELSFSSARISDLQQRGVI